MFVIGQGLNILDGRIYQAVRERNGEAVRKTAKRQLKEGADGLDINLGSWNQCARTLTWLVEQVRAVSKCPLFLPPSPEGLFAAIRKAGPGSFINCVTADTKRLKSMLSAAECLDASVVVLLTKKGYLPGCLDEICITAEEVLELAERRRFPVGRLLLDPVLRPRTGCFPGRPSAVFPDISLFMEAVYLVGKLREKKVKTIAGLSNISCGLPGRIHNSLQLQMLSMLKMAGLDYVIMHTGDRELMAAARENGSMEEMKKLFLDSDFTSGLPDVTREY